MSASARERDHGARTFSMKYKRRISMERGDHGPRTGVPMYSVETGRRFRERLIVAKARSVGK